MIPRIEALRGTKFSDLDADGREAARLCLLYAEQWEESLADALRTSGKTAMAPAVRAARLFRTTRHQVWGKTHLEHICETAQTLSVTEILARGLPWPEIKSGDN